MGRSRSLWDKPKFSSGSAAELLAGELLEGTFLAAAELLERMLLNAFLRFGLGRF